MEKREGGKGRVSRVFGLEGEEEDELMGTPLTRDSMALFDPACVRKKEMDWKEEKGERNMRESRQFRGCEIEKEEDRTLWARRAGERTMGVSNPLYPEEEMRLPRSPC